MAKPIGPLCNLGCRYCFYLEKETLYPGGEKWRMSPEVLESFVRQYIQSQETPEVTFAWQGGEPTLLGVEFFERVVSLQQQYAAGKKIHNALQTNGTLLDDRWCEFFAKHGFLIGLSIDGPRHLHDAYRVDKHDKPSFDAVMRGLDCLRKYKAEFNTLTVVNRANAPHPLEVYQFLKRIGSQFIQFIPLVERLSSTETGSQQPATGNAIPLAGPPQTSSPQSAAVAPWSVDPREYGRFLCEIFDHWVRHDVGQTFVQIFDVALGIWSGHGSGLCVFSEECGRATALEHNGDLYACDHYVYPQYKLGNIIESPLTALANSEMQRQFGRAKSESLPQMCRQCDVRFACHGECPKHRFMTTPEGEAGLNYLCPAYKRFFRHIDPAMKTMTALLRSRRPPAEIMSLLARNSGGAAPCDLKPIQATRPASAALAGGQSSTTRPGRNDACPCGSGQKYKKCCGR